MDTDGKVIAGGQTGVDTAALNVASELGIPTGGFCPRTAEDANGPISGEKLVQWNLTPVTDQVWESGKKEAFLELNDIPYDVNRSGSEADVFAERTMLNLLHSDGTLTIAPEPVADGTNLGLAAAKAIGKPTLVVDLQDPVADLETLKEWIQTNSIRRLNFNGPRESSIPGIQERATQIFTKWFPELRSLLIN